MARFHTHEKRVPLNREHEPSVGVCLCRGDLFPRGTTLTWHSVKGQEREVTMGVTKGRDESDPYAIVFFDGFDTMPYFTFPVKCFWKQFLR